jgi:hypothetical protein
MKTTIKDITTYQNNWELKVFGGLNKNQIRQLSKKIFKEYYGFTTLENATIDENNNIVLTIELSNVSKKNCKNSYGIKYAKILSSNTSTYNFKFKCYKNKTVLEDFHNYEPSKISFGTFSNRNYIYIILIGTKI